MSDHSQAGRTELPVKAVVLCMAAVLVVALASRVGWTAYRWAHASEGAGLQFPDERDYWTAALSLARGHGLVDGDGRRATRMPLYPAWLSIFARLPDGAWWARVAQAVPAALAAPLIALLAWRLGGTRAGWAAGLLMAIDPFAVYFSHLLLTEATVMTAIAALWLICWPLGLPDGRRRTWRWPVSGFLFLMLVYLHPSMLGLGIVLAMFIAFAAHRAGGSFSGITWTALLVLAGLGPWCWRNYQLLGDPVVLTTRTGISLFDGHGPRADGSSNLGYTREMPEDRLPEPQWNREFRDKALSAMWDDPWRSIRLGWAKCCRTWSPFPHAAEAQSRGIRALSIGWTFGVYLLALIGFWHWRRCLGVVILLFLPAVYLTMVHMVFVGSIRYRLPAMPLIDVLSAVGLCRLLALAWPSWRPSYPPARVYPGDHQPPSRIQRWLSGYRYGRHPVPLWRRRLALASLFVLGCGYYAYQYFTSDERIRKQAVAFLTQFSGGEVRVGQARFSFFSGVALRDVLIALPPEVDFDPTAKSLQDRQVFAAREVQLHHEPFSLLVGRLKVAEIVANQPTVTLVKNPEHPRYAYNWQMLFPSRPQKRARGSGSLPTVCVRNARVQISEIREGRRKAEPDIELSALARPDRHRSNTYTIPWRKLGDRPERGRLYYRLGSGTYTGELPALPMTTVKASLPPGYTEWLESLEIAGQIKPEHVHYDSRHGSRAAIRLEDVRLSVPMTTEQRPTTQAAGRFIKLTGVTGQLVLTPTESSARIKGRLNGAPCDVAASVTNYAGPLEDAGFDIRLQASGVRLPDPKDPVGARFIEPIAKLRSFFGDFDPHGRVDVDLQLFKSPGRDMGVLLRGTLRALDCDASYKNFPYRCQGIRGVVRFADDGIYIENLLCQHGSGVVVINGRVDGANWYDGLDLDIVGDNVPLDPDLHQAIPEKFKTIWNRFDPVGLANLTIRLKRGPGSLETGPGSWNTSIEADFIDAQARFEGFPYMLKHLAGRLTVHDNQIALDRLRGSHGPASVRIDGMACYAGLDDSELDLRIESRDLALDGDLSDALPSDSQSIFRQLRPAGRADLIGRVFMMRGSRETSYSVAAHLRDALMCPETIPVPIDRITGTLGITPQAIVVEQVEGRRGPTIVSASGRIERREEGFSTDMTVSCNRLQLDTPLRSALPEGLKKIWDDFAPRGEINIRTHIRRTEARTEQLSAHDTSIEALGNSLCYKGLPLPVDDVRGRIHLNNDRVQLSEMTARHGAGYVRLSGQIPLVGNERTGRMVLGVRDMPFGESLRKALPKRMGEVWQVIKPTGSFDLDLSELAYRVGSDRPMRWDYRGRITLHNATLDAGFQASQIEGSLGGSGTAAADGSDMTFDGTLDVKRIAVNGRVLTDVTGRVRRDAGSDLLVFDQLAGKAYGGQAVGFGQVHLGSGQTGYALRLVARDMELGPFLNATRPKDVPPTPATGYIDGRLCLSGVSGKAESRQGTGEAHIGKAQMYKLPFVLAMLSAINFTIPDENAFHDAHATFEIQGNRLHFDTIELKGRSLSMLGKGWMNTDTEELDLRFITGSPHELPRLPLLLELARGASREIMEIAITGPLSKPNMVGRPMYTLRTALDALFDPRKKEPAKP